MVVAEVRIWTATFGAAACGVVFLLVMSLAPLASAATPQLWLIWAEPGDQYSEIRLTHKSGKIWQAPQLLNDGAHLDVAPCVAVAEDGRMWVAWTRMMSLYESELITRSFDGESWTPAARMPTPTKANTGPVFALGQDGLPWLFWAGYDGSDDEMFVSRWQSTGVWSTPERVAANDSTPDVQALAGVDDAQLPWLTWFGLHGEGYARFKSHWRDGEWRPEEVIEDDDPLLERINAQLRRLPQAPAEVSEPAGACVAMRDAGTLDVVPLRFVTKAPAGTPLDVN